MRLAAHLSARFLGLSAISEIAIDKIAIPEIPLHSTCAMYV